MDKYRQAAHTPTLSLAPLVHSAGERKVSSLGWWVLRLTCLDDVFCKHIFPWFPALCVLCLLLFATERTRRKMGGVGEGGGGGGGEEKEEEEEEEEKRRRRMDEGGRK